jgi:SPP1 gp7 family putative phage head morphogenesis protein
MRNGYPLALERQYIRLVEKFLAEIRREAMRAATGPQPVTDGLIDVQRILQRLQINYEKSPLLEKLRAATRGVFQSVANFSKRYAMKPGNGIEVDSSIFTLPPISPQQIEGVVEKNVQLIGEAGKKYLETIQANVQKAILEGRGTKELAKILEENTGASKNKARLWASDQLKKAHAEISRTTQRAAGFEEYIWRTQKDGRVMDMHAHLEGTKQRYDDPPVTNENGDRNNPGEDYNCRCFSEPALPDTEADSPQERLAALIKIQERNVEMEKYNKS